MSRKRIVIMNGLIVLAFNREPGNSRQTAQGKNRIAQDILDKFGIVVSRFRYILFIFTF